jgi:hypothetical protein
VEKEMKKKFRSFEDSRKFVQSLNLKGKTGWREYCKSSDKPDDIPSTPNTVYKNKGWINWGDWFGTATSSKGEKKWKSFDESKKFVQKLGLKGYTEWQEYCRSHNKPDNIPSNPYIIYKENGWNGYGDWLGNGQPVKLHNFRSYNEAKKFVHSLGLKNMLEWKDYCKSGRKPSDIPTHPEKTYSKKGKK